MKYNDLYGTFSVYHINSNKPDQEVDSGILHYILVIITLILGAQNPLSVTAYVKPLQT